MTETNEKPFENSIHSKNIQIKQFKYSLGLMADRLSQLLSHLFQLVSMRRSFKFLFAYTLDI